MKILTCIVLMLVGPALTHAQLSLNKGRRVTGTYRLRKDEQRNTFEVRSVGGNRIKFHLLALWVSPYNPDNVHNGEVFGTIPLKNGTAIFKDESCQLTIRFTRLAVIITQAEEVGDCDFGANVNASGVYRKVSSSRPSFDF